MGKLFAPSFRFGTGAITDAHNSISGQIDIVIENTFAPSFPMPAGDHRLYLAESVAVALEVKSDLAAQWGEVRDTVRKVKALRRDLGPALSYYQSSTNDIPTIAVGFRGHTTVAGLLERVTSTPEAERPDCAVVIESGCFVSPTIRSEGPSGLFSLAAFINAQLQQHRAAFPDLFRYSNMTSLGYEPPVVNTADPDPPR